jgi:hypothetical protein
MFASHKTWKIGTGTSEYCIRQIVGRLAEVGWTRQSVSAFVPFCVFSWLATALLLTTLLYTWPSDPSFASHKKAQDSQKLTNALCR